MKKLFWPLSLLLTSTSMEAKELSGKVSQERLISDVNFLTSTPLPRHFLNKGSLKITADYIKKVFRDASSDVEVQNFEVKDIGSYENIIASFGPKKAPRFIIGAHYDVFGHYPGADDNASGVAAILEMARLLQKEKVALKHRIDLVAYALEEPPFFASQDMGSAHHARMLKENKAEVRMMLALDMIGYFSDKPDSQERPGPLKAIYPDRGNFIAVVGSLSEIFQTNKIKKLMLEGAPGLKVEAVNAPTAIPGVDFSDHRNFWEQGYPGLMITDTAFYRNPHYHTAKDTPESLDFERMSLVVQGLYHAAINF